MVPDLYKVVLGSVLRKYFLQSELRGIWSGVCIMGGLYLFRGTDLGSIFVQWVWFVFALGSGIWSISVYEGLMYGLYLFRSLHCGLYYLRVLVCAL